MERRFLCDIRKNNSLVLHHYQIDTSFNITRLQSHFDNPIDKKKQIKSYENDVGELRLWCTRERCVYLQKKQSYWHFLFLQYAAYFIAGFYSDSLSSGCRFYVIQPLETSELQLSPCLAIISFPFFFLYSRCARKICILQMKTTHVRRRPLKLKLIRMVQPPLSTSHLLTARTTNGM